jgi:iron complex outermembrane receptor protein
MRNSKGQLNLSRQPFRLRAVARTIGHAFIGATIATPVLLAPALAQTAEVRQVAARKTYDIPAGPLEATLNRFGREAGILLSFTANRAAGLRSNGLQGSYSVREALPVLLEGTGLAAVAQANGGYSLIKQSEPVAPETVATLPAVTVNAEALRGDLPKPYAGGQVARGGGLGMLGDRDFMDAPFNITSYMAQTIQDQQARTIADVVINDPSVRNVNPSAGRFDQFAIRGFGVLNSDIAFGGLYGVLPTYAVDVEIADRVEILKGPGALLNGIAPNGSIGGGINVMPKRADDAPLTEVTGTFASDSQVGAHIDIGRRFGEDNRFGLRINGVSQSGDTAVDHQAMKRGMGALGLDFRGDRLRLSGDIGHQERRVGAPLERVGVVDGVVVPDADRIRGNFAQRWTHADTRDTYAALRGEYDIAPDLTVYAAAGARRGRYDFLRMNVSARNNMGDFAAAPMRFLRDEEVRTAQAGLRAGFDTGSIRHAINLNLSTFNLEFGNGSLSLPPSLVSNLYVPIDRAAPVQTRTPAVPKGNETTLSSLALADTMSFAGDRVLLTLGARAQTVKVDTFDAAGVKTSGYDENAVSPALGLVVKPWQNVSLYGNYIEGLTRGPTAPTTAANAGEVFAPYKSKQIEAGLKADFGRFAGTLSVFRIRQPNEQTDPATNVYGLDGEQRNQGIELNVFGTPARGVRLLGGVMLLDGELSSTAGNKNNGNTAPGSPVVSLNLGTEWDTSFLPGLTLTARMIHTSSQYLNDANTQQIGSWERFDLGARYAFNAGRVPVTIRASLENVFDKRYWASASANGLTLSTPRTLLVSASLAF